MKPRNRPLPSKQVSRKLIRVKLAELGILEYFDRAAAGDMECILKLRRLAKCNKEVKSALILVLPRRSTAIGSMRKKMWSLERAGQLATGFIRFVQGGAPGLKK